MGVTWRSKLVTGVIVLQLDCTPVLMFVSARLFLVVICRPTLDVERIVETCEFRSTVILAVLYFNGR